MKYLLMVTPSCQCIRSKQTGALLGQCSRCRAALDKGFASRCRIATDPVVPSPKGKRK